MKDEERNPEAAKRQGAIKRLVWRLRFTWHMRRNSGVPARVAWAEAKGASDGGCNYFTDGYSPASASWESMSYWD